MKRNVLFLMVGTLCVMSAWPLFSAEAVQLGDAHASFVGKIKLRVFEGLKEGSPPAGSITSSYLKYMLSASLPSDTALEAEQNQIRKTFNLKDVKLVTEFNVILTKGEGLEARHMFRLDGKLYAVAIASREVLPQKFQIEVNEVSENESRNLLDTEFTIPSKSVAVFGFEDSNGRPYFISLGEVAIGISAGAGGGVTGGVSGGVQGGVAGGVEGGVEGGVKGGVEGGVVGGVLSQEMEKKRQEFEKDAVPCKGDIKPPKLLKKAEPVYPGEARKKGIQGVVILEAKIDESGRVMDAMILRSVPELDQAAIDAVQQWVYEPPVIDGKPTKVLFTVTVRFQLNEKDIEKFAEGAVKVKDQINPPKLVKSVDPVYPEIARQAKIEGVVIVQARTDAQGRVKDAMVLRSVPLLDQAAIDAVRQWVYEPLVIDEQAKEAVFTVTVRFTLDAEKPKGQGEGPGTTGEILVPKLVKKVDPVYPEIARMADIQGIVLLEATTDEKGNVVKVRVLKSIPLLDQAAVEALKQWKYEPLIIEGKPKGVVFTVTIRFALK
jgi:TonB family protein